MNKPSVASTRTSWRDVTVYLAGPMEFAKDGGIEWRQTIQSELVSKLGIQQKNILNPCDKPDVFGANSLADEVALQQEMRERGDWEGLENAMKQIITIDLRMVDRSDVVIAYLPHDVRIAGTVHEIVSARNQKKPVVAIVPDGFKSMSGWLMALIGHRRCFKTIDEAVGYLSDVQQQGPSCEKDAKEFVIFDFEKGDD